MKSPDAREWEKAARTLSDSMLTALDSANRAIKKGDTALATRWENQYNLLYGQLMKMIQDMPNGARAPRPPKG